MFAYEPEERITINQIFNEPYCKIQNPNEETLTYFRNKVVSELGNII